MCRWIELDDSPNDCASASEDPARAARARAHAKKSGWEGQPACEHAVEQEKKEIHIESACGREEDDGTKEWQT